MIDEGKEMADKILKPAARHKAKNKRLNHKFEKKGLKDIKDPYK